MKEQIIKILEEHISFKTGALLYSDAKERILIFDKHKNTFLHINLATLLESERFVCWFSCEKVDNDIKAVLNVSTEHKLGVK